MVRNYALSDDARAERDAKKQATRDALISAARDLFAAKGYDRTSVTEIGRKAGVSHTLINAYFGGKAGLLARVVHGTNAPQAAITRELLEQDRPTLGVIRDVLNRWATADLADRSLLAVLQATSWQWDAEFEAENRKERAVFTSAMADLVARARISGEATGEVAPADVAEAIFAIYTWGMRSALFEELEPVGAIDAIWPQICAVLGVRSGE